MIIFVIVFTILFVGTIAIIKDVTKEILEE